MARILVVDDAAFMRMSIKKMLEGTEYEVVAEAANGEEAVEQYVKLKPDLVTMDITMPKMNGIEAVGEILKIDPKAKVIMFSAMGQQNMVLEAIEAGAKGFVVKPFKKEGIIEAISKQLNS